MAEPPSRVRVHAHVPLSAILLITASVLCFTLLDALVKSLTQRYPVPMLVWARYGVQALAMALWLLPQMGAALMRTNRLGMHLVRAAILPFSTLCFFSALKYLPLAEATAINYSTPVLVIILAVIFLGERMTRSRIALVIAGVSRRRTWPSVSQPRRISATGNPCWRSCAGGTATGRSGWPCIPARPSRIR